MIRHRGAILFIIIIIRHELSLGRPVLASYNGIFKGLPSAFIWSIIQHYFWHPVVQSFYISSPISFVSS